MSCDLHFCFLEPLFTTKVFVYTIVLQEKIGLISLIESSKMFNTSVETEMIPGTVRLYLAAPAGEATFAGHSFPLHDNL